MVTTSIVLGGGGGIFSYGNSFMMLFAEYIYIYIYIYPFSFHFRCSNATKFTVSVDPEGTTVGDFKERIAEEADVPAPNQRLIYRGRVLKDDQQLSFYGMHYFSLTLLEMQVRAPSPLYLHVLLHHKVLIFL